MNPPHRPSTAAGLAASVRDRLLAQAKAKNEEFQSLLTRYAGERFLYRLSQSPYQEQFLLKGATLFTVWSGQPHRATRDIDLLGFGENSVAYLEEIFRTVCSAEVEVDGLVFNPSTVRGAVIKEGEEYEGVRLKILALLGQARIELQVDIGFGDAVTPTPYEIALPTLLDFPAAKLRAYPPETVVAEKFQAMTKLGMANSRMKDFYDVWSLSKMFCFDGEVLSQAIAATFARRDTLIPSTLPLALTPTFSGDQDKQRQWQAFIRKGKLQAGELTLEAVIEVLQGFLLPPTQALDRGEAFSSNWNPSQVRWEKVVPKEPLK